MLLLAPLPLSTWLAPYHAVIMLPAFVLLLSVAVDARWPARIRGAAVAAPLAYELLRFCLPAWEFRAGVFYCAFVFILAALGMVRMDDPIETFRADPAEDAVYLPLKGGGGIERAARRV